MPEGTDKLSIVVFDGGYDRVHYALVMASAAAATNRAVTLFFTGPALTALTPDGWRRLAGDPAAADAALTARGVAGFETLLEACRDLDVCFIACEMGLRATGLDAADLAPDLTVEIAGVVTFLNQAPKTGQIVFI